jgi:hypothetical protein
MLKECVRRTRGVYTLPAFQKFQKLIVYPKHPEAVRCETLPIRGTHSA